MKGERTHRKRNFLSRRLSTLLINLFCILVAQGATAATLLYDVDFCTPPHTVGLPPVAAAGNPPRNTVSQVVMGAPTVVSSFGELTDQPLLFDTYGDGVPEQIRLRLNDLPTSKHYCLEVDMVIGSMQDWYGFTIFFDVPTVRRIDFWTNETVNIMPSLSGRLIGHYTLGTKVHVRVEIDLEADRWHIFLDDVLARSESLYGATTLRSIRFSTQTIVSEGVSAAIDNIVVKSGDCASIVTRPCRCTDEAAVFFTENEPSVPSNQRLSAVVLDSGIPVVIAVNELSGPIDVALNSTETTAFVVEEQTDIPVYSGRLSAVDISTGTVTRVATGLKRPWGIAVNCDGTIAYIVENQPVDNGKLLSIDLATGAANIVASGLRRPRSVDLNKDATTAYVTTLDDGRLSAIDLSTGAVRTIVSGLNYPTGVAVSYDESKGWVTEFQGNKLTWIDITSGTIIDSIPMDRPRSIAVNARSFGSDSYIEEEAYVTQLPLNGDHKLVKVHLLAGTITTIATGLRYPGGVALGCAVPTGIQQIKIPVRWSGCEGAPSMENPGQVLETTTDDVLLARLQRVSDQVYMPQARIAFRSGATSLMPSFPIIPDPDTSIGQPGDVLDFTIDPTEYQQLIHNCRAIWEAADPSVKGILAVQINKFVDRNGNRTALLGLGGYAFGSSPSRITTIDPAYLLPCSEQGEPCLDGFGFWQEQSTLGHELGHALSLMHGNGVDDNGDGVIDDTAEDEENASDFLTGHNLMQYGGGLSLTSGQCVQARRFALLNIPDVIVDPVPLPLCDNRTDELRDVNESERYIDIESLGMSVDRNDTATTFSQDIAGMLPKDVSGLRYFFLVDIDNNLKTGGMPTDIKIPIIAQGIEFAALVEVNATRGIVAAVPTVYRFDDKSPVRIDDSRIRAAVMTRYLSAAFDDPNHRTPIFERVEAGQVIQLEMPNAVRGPIGPEVRLITVAESPSGSFDTAEARLTFRLPVMPGCVVDPPIVQHGSRVTVSLSDFPSPGKVQVFLGSDLVGDGFVGADGSTTITFDLPHDAATGNRLVTARLLGTAITANGALYVKSGEEPKQISDSLQERNAD
jgi:hypothetical protein